MSNEVKILVYSKYFLDYLQLYLTKTKDMKNIFVGNIFIKNTIDVFFNSISAKNVFI